MKHIKKAHDRGASVRFPPPLVFVIFITLSYSLHWYLPIELGAEGFGMPLGAIIIAIGLGVIFIASLSLFRLGTAIEPWKPTTQIATRGIFAYSRNPIYLALCVITLGLGVLLNSLWVLLSALPSAVMVYYIAIQKEERYLLGKFGQPYLDYCQKVRRWF